MMMMMKIVVVKRLMLLIVGMNCVVHEGSVGCTDKNFHCWFFFFESWCC